MNGYSEQLGVNGYSEQVGINGYSEQLGMMMDNLFGTFYATDTHLCTL